jgi:hypothetical protein
MNLWRRVLTRDGWEAIELLHSFFAVILSRADSIQKSMSWGVRRWPMPKNSHQTVVRLKRSTLENPPWHDAAALDFQLHG